MNSRTKRLQKQLDDMVLELDAVKYVSESRRRDNLRLVEQVATANRTSARLALLCATVDRVHRDLERPTVIDAIGDILRNIVGAEQYAILEIVSDGSFAIAGSRGIDTGAIDVNALENVWKSVANGELYVPAATAADGILACIPLSRPRQAVGAIVIWRLLEAKAALAASDIEIFNLLATHAAVALLSSANHSIRRITSPVPLSVEDV